MPKAERKHGFYRGVYVPVGLSLLRRMVTELNTHKHSNWSYTCHLVQALSGSGPLVDAWGDFLEELGISICGAGFATPENDGRFSVVSKAPQWLRDLNPKADTRNKLRLSLIEDIITEAFDNA